MERLLYDFLRSIIFGEFPQVNSETIIGVDLDIVTKYISNQGVGGLIYYRLKDNQIIVDSDKCPDAFEYILDYCRKEYFQNHARNLANISQLLNVITKFEENEIPVILLKGISLIHRVYDDVGVRPMGDIDLIINPWNLRKANQLIKSCGYDLLKSTYHLSYCQRSNDSYKVYIDLHWLIGSERFTKALWSELTPLEAYTNVFLSNLHIEYIYLYFHNFIEHKSNRLIWQYDLELVQGFINNEQKGRQKYRNLAKHDFGLGNGEDAMAIERAFSFYDLARVSLLKRHLLAISVLDFPDNLFVIIRSILPSTIYMRSKYLGKKYKNIIWLYIMRWGEIIKGKMSERKD